LDVDSTIAGEFCRYLFRVGGATAALRNVFLDGLSEAAISAQMAGSSVLSTSANGASVQLQFVAGWSPVATLKIVEAARVWAAYATVEAALATITPSRRVSYGSFAGASL
jgi:hypothetical protein